MGLTWCRVEGLGFDAKSIQLPCLSLNRLAAAEPGVFQMDTEAAVERTRNIEKGSVKLSLGEGFRGTCGRSQSGRCQGGGAKEVSDSLWKLAVLMSRAL